MDEFGPVSRRCVLRAAAALTSFATGVGASPAAAHSKAAYDPRSSAEGQVKLNATLDGSPAFWSYSGIIYAVLPNARPAPLLRVSGCQANWAVRQADDSFRMAAPLLTFFRGIDTGAFLDFFDNPLSGCRNEVHANMFLGKGRAVYPPDGSAMRITGEISASQSAPNGFKQSDSTAGIGRVEWSLTRDCIVLNSDQFFNVQLQPQGEAQTRTADRSLFFDPAVNRLPARFSATTISPWLAWMDMGSVAGHLVWHTEGEKVFSVDGVPADYRTRAGNLLDALTARPRFQAT